VPVEIPDYQVTPELIDKLNEYLEVFKGTNNFFNYTIRMDKNDASAKRYIIGFKVSSRPRISLSPPLAPSAFFTSSRVLQHSRARCGALVLWTVHRRWRGLRSL
jgi:hypothetical protein